MRMGTVFPQINALPGTQCQLAIADRNCQVHVGQYASNMCRHVIRAFICMSEHWAAIWNGISHKRFQVGANRWISIFTQDNRSTGVLNKDMAQAGCNATLADYRGYITGNVARTPASRMKLQGFLISFTHY